MVALPAFALRHWMSVRMPNSIATTKRRLHDIARAFPLAILSLLRLYPEIVAWLKAANA